MTKQDIERALQKIAANKAFITTREVARAMGQKNDHRVKKKYLDGLPRVDGKYFLIKDVAKVLMERSY